jgi:hypothetical protein
MSFGFQFEGAGWLVILERLYFRLQPLARDGFAIVCVKSKYATLRIYCRGGSEAIDDEIETAKAEAARTCQICGAAGALRVVGGWRAVRCRACAE